MTKEEKMQVLTDSYHRLLANGYLKNKKELAEMLDINYSTLCSAFGGNDKYLTDSLLTKIVYLLDNKGLGKVETLGAESVDMPLTIPLLPTSARAGSLADFADSVKAYECEKIISPIKGVDYAMQITGDSMSPEYPNGSHILIKKIDPTAFIPFGNVLVLDTCNGAVIKQIFPTDKDNVIECRSLNPLYPSFKVKMEDVYGWYRVLMCLSLK